MSDSIGDRILFLADDYRRAGERQDLGARAETWNRLCGEMANVDAYEAIARATMAKHRAALRADRWWELYDAARGQSVTRARRLGNKAEAATARQEALERAEAAAVKAWGGRL